MTLARRLRSCLTPLTLLFVASPGFAADFYVDATSGNNANDGATPGTAWQTISFAVAQAPGSGTTIHIAPGLYDSALGEAFPIVPQPGQTLSGFGGRPIVDGGGFAGGVITLPTAGCTLPELVRLDTLWLRDAGTGVLASSAADGSFNGELSGLLITDMFLRGIHLRTVFDTCANTVAQVAMDDVQVEECTDGILVEDASTANVVSAGVNVTMTDSLVLRNTKGIEVAATLAGAGSATLSGDHLRIHHNAGRGLQTVEDGRASLVDSLVYKNHGGVFFADLTRCTVADNQNRGVWTAPHNQVDSCIIFGNSSDYFGATQDLSYSLVGTGWGAGVNGNIDADPLFVDAQGHDYRLQTGSAAIDVANPALPVDCDGTRADMGALPKVTCFQSFCAGDGFGAACPCGNSGDLDHGCNNGQFTGGVAIDATGDPTDGELVFWGYGFPLLSSPTAALIRSQGQAGGGQGVVFGDGLLCLADPVVRLRVGSSERGVLCERVSHGAGPGVFHYQLWYRSTPAGFCDPTAAFNLSNGLTVTWP